MSKYNAKVSKKPNAVSYEGGSVYQKSPVEQWMNFLFSSYMEDRFYESGQKQTQTFYNLTMDMIHTYGADFVARASFFARNELGMRSAAQYVAALINNCNFDGKREFYKNFCHRPDDVAEVFGALDTLPNRGKRSHAMVRGFGDYISSLTPYTLGKYKLNNHAYNMYDLINITHAHSDAIDAYKMDALETPDTWETAISGAGSAEAREQEWKRLVEENKLGYLALIRNLRNILNCEITDSWIKKYLVPQITNKKAIHNSLIFPYQIYSAYVNMPIHNTKVVDALSDAFKISLNNMPHLSGNTLVMLDVSGSMDSKISAKSNISIREVGAVYAMCVLLTSNHSEFIKFGTHACKHTPHKNNNIFEEIFRMQDNAGLGYGTEIEPAYALVNKKYDRIILISDMQIMERSNYLGWGSRAGIKSYEHYCEVYGPTPIYSFDLGNYSTQTNNPNNPNVHLCTSLSEKTFKMINLLEDEKSLIKYINDNYDFHDRH